MPNLVRKRLFHGVTLRSTSNKYNTRYEKLKREGKLYNMYPHGYISHSIRKRSSRNIVSCRSALSWPPRARESGQFPQECTPSMWSTEAKSILAATSAVERTICKNYNELCG